MYEKIRSQAIDNVTVTGRLERAEVAERLATYDIGLLPMPPRTIWKLASPLKRAEYLGSGLCVLGIDHEGHRLPDRSPATFMKLYPQSEFLEQAQAWLSGLKRQALTKEQRESRKYAEQRLQWSQSVDALLRLFVNKSRPTLEILSIWCISTDPTRSSRFVSFNAFFQSSTSPCRALTTVEGRSTMVSEATTGQLEANASRITNG